VLSVEVCEGLSQYTALKMTDDSKLKKEFKIISKIWGRILLYCKQFPNRMNTVNTVPGYFEQRGFEKALCLVWYITCICLFY
jgi:hypothetical protein